MSVLLLQLILQPRSEQKTPSRIIDAALNITGLVIFVQIQEVFCSLIKHEITVTGVIVFIINVMCYLLLPVPAGIMLKTN